MQTLEIAALGLRQDLERLKLQGHNLANISTPGYKRQVAVQTPFADLMQAADVQAAPTTTLDLRPGKLQATGRALDLALPDGSFLLLERTDGSLALSRHAALQVDAEGWLRGPSGDKVLGQGGAIRLRGDLRELAIDGSGRISLQGQAVDSLRLIGLKAEARPEPLGDGLYAAEPGHWLAEQPATGLRSGHLEQSNVVSSQEMVQLMGTTRHAETMVRLFQAADSMLDTAIRRFGETS